MSRNAAAQKGLELHAPGTCPTRAQLAAALHTRDRTPLDDPDPLYAGWSLTVTQLPKEKGAIEMVLLAPNRTVAIKRVVSSDDCEALADVVALIVREHFAQLRLSGLRTGSNDSPPSVVEPSGATTIGSETSKTATQSPKAQPSISVTDSGADSARGSLPGSEASPAAQLERDSTRGLMTPGRSRPRGLLLAAAGGLEAAVSPRWPGGFGQLEVHWQTATPLLFALSISAASPMERGPTSNFVSHQQTALRARMGWTMGTAWWLSPRAGIALVINRVHGPEMGGGVSARRQRLAATASLAVGRTVAERWSIYIEVGALVFAQIDRYVLEPTTIELATSPRATASWGLGLQRAIW